MGPPSKTTDRPGRSVLVVLIAAVAVIVNPVVTMTMTMFATVVGMPGTTSTLAAALAGGDLR